MTTYRQYDGWSTLTVEVDEATAAALEPPLLDDSDRAALWSAAPEPWAGLARAVRYNARAEELARLLVDRLAEGPAAADAADAAYERQLIEEGEPITVAALAQIGRHRAAWQAEAEPLEHRRSRLPQYAAAGGLQNLDMLHKMEATPAQRTTLVGWLEACHSDKKAPFAPAVYAREYARLLDPGYPHPFRGLEMAQSDRPIEAYEWRQATRLWSPWSPAMAVLESHAAARLAYQRAARAAFLGSQGLRISSFT